MAHIVQIPVEFGFRIAKVEWSVASPRITGWWKRDDGTVDSENLIAEISADAWEKELVRFPLQELPVEEWERCVEVPIDEGYDDEIELICSGFEPQWLVPSVQVYYWTSSEFMKLSPGDAWQMRDDFLRMASNHESAIAFLNKWGHWRGGWTDLGRMLKLQRQVREALSSSSHTWFTGSVPPYLDLWKRDPEYPFFALRTCRCETAICMTVTIDLLRRAKFKICVRKDCRVPFEVKSRHKRKYCSQYCGHLESVRRNRKKIE